MVQADWGRSVTEVEIRLCDADRGGANWNDDGSEAPTVRRWRAVLGARRPEDCARIELEAGSRPTVESLGRPQRATPRSPHQAFHPHHYGEKPQDQLSTRAVHAPMARSDTRELPGGGPPMTTHASLFPSLAQTVVCGGASSCCTRAWTKDDARRDSHGLNWQPLWVVVPT